MTSRTTIRVMTMLVLAEIKMVMLKLIDATDYSLSNMLRVMEVSMYSVLTRTGSF